MSWKPEVFVDGKWLPNQFAFATSEEASLSALDLFRRWTQCSDHRAVESKDRVNYRYVDGMLEAINHA